MAETASSKNAEELSPKSAASSPKGASPPAAGVVDAEGQVAPLDADDDGVVIGEACPWSSRDFQERGLRLAIRTLGYRERDDVAVFERS